MNRSINSMNTRRTPLFLFVLVNTRRAKIRLLSSGFWIPLLNVKPSISQPGWTSGTFSVWPHQDTPFSSLHGWGVTPHPWSRAQPKGCCPRDAGVPQDTAWAETKSSTSAIYTMQSWLYSHGCSSYWVKMIVFPGGHLFSLISRCLLSIVWNPHILAE